jgi:hypothetical protein
VLFVVGTVDVLPIPAPTTVSVLVIAVQEGRIIRGECDRRANTTSTLLLRQVKRVISSARSATERILLLVAEAPVAELLLLAGLRTQHGVTNDHAESLSASA